MPVGKKAGYKAAKGKSINGGGTPGKSTSTSVGTVRGAVKAQAVVKGKTHKGTKAKMRPDMGKKKG